MVQWPNLTRFLSRRFAPMQQAMSTPMRYAWLALPGWVVLKRLIPTDGFGGLWLAHVIPLAYLAVLFIWTKVKERKFTSYAQKSPYPYEVLASLGKLSCHAAEGELYGSVDRQIGDQWEQAITAFRSIMDTMKSPRVENLNAEYPGLDLSGRMLRMADGACIECLMIGRQYVRELHEKPRNFTKRMATSGVSSGDLLQIKAYVRALQQSAGKLHDVGNQEEPLPIIEGAIDELEKFRHDQARTGSYHFPII